MRAGCLLRLVWRGALAVGLFLLTVRLLGEAAGRLRPALEEGLPAVVTSGPAALGAAWTATHLELNGTVVAAVTLTLGASGVLSPIGSWPSGAPASARPRSWCSWQRWTISVSGGSAYGSAAASSRESWPCC